MQDLLRWLNGWVYTLFGAEGLAMFSAHPYQFTLLLVLVTTVLSALLGAWGLRRLRRWRDDLGTLLRLAASAQGRHCLALSRRIRRGAGRLRHAIRREVDDRQEQRALLTLLERFTRSHLREVLHSAAQLIQGADDRREYRLRGQLAGQIDGWNTAQTDAERERLQQAIARTRHQLALVEPANEARTRHIAALAGAADAVQALEVELAGVHHARDRALPEFRDHLHAAARNMGDLRNAYRELEDSR